MKFFQISRSVRATAVLLLAFAIGHSADLFAQESAAPDAQQNTEVTAEGQAFAAVAQAVDGESDRSESVADESMVSDEARPPKAESIDLKDVIIELDSAPAATEEPAVEKKEDFQSDINSGSIAVPNKLLPDTSPGGPSTDDAAQNNNPAPDASPQGAVEPAAPSQEPMDQESAREKLPQQEANEPAVVVAEEAPVVPSKVILGVEVPPNTSTRLVWTPEDVVSGLAERTPILVVNGKNPGQTLCLTGAVHGDELNGIEMIRRIMYQLEPENLTGTVIGVPVVNIMGFRRNSRYLPDRRDLNRYFPGNTHGSSASRIAHSFFTGIISHCDALVDIHTGSFHRTNLTQLRADLSNEKVATLAQNFGVIAVLNSRGNSGSLRAAAVRAGIPSVTVEAGEPMRMQSDVVAEGTKAIETLLAKMEMYGRTSKWSRQAPVYYKSVWVRANQSGILFSRVPLGKRIIKGEVLGTVTDPITNAQSDIVSPYQGRILGMALDQVVLPGFAAYHIGIQTPEAILIEEGFGADEDGDDAPPQNSESTGEMGGAKQPDILDDEE